MLRPPTEPSSQDFERAARSGPKGAVALCGIAVCIVIGIWVAFYCLAFLPRGMLR